jgi:chemotaxis protein MotB
MFVRKSRRKKLDEGEPTVDMLAFSSVMTILLAFFIMLASHAGAPDEKSAKEALMSVQEAFVNYGISKVPFGGSGAIINMPNNYTGKYKKEDQWVNNELANTIDEEVEIEYIQMGHRVVFPTKINFVKEELDMSSETKIYLNNLIKVIKDRDCQVIVEGYIDGKFVPSDKHPTSWHLSAEYASAVTKYFNDVGGIDYKRLTAIGYGIYQPLLSKGSSLTKANNRISITISDK